MKNLTNFFTGLFVGAGVMYLLDPDRGNRRRALLRDQAIHAGHEVDDLRGGMFSTARHLRNRVRGTVVEARSRFQRESVDDAVLDARIRSELGRITDLTGPVQISVNEGEVILHGSVPGDMMDKIVATVYSVRGVSNVDSRLRAQGAEEPSFNVH